MTPEERAKSVLHFLDMYLDARAALMEGRASLYTMENSRNLLGTALVALVTEARKPDDHGPPDPWFIEDLPK